jgi:3-hydroxyacyl-CoA dehydrogenase
MTSDPHTAAALQYLLDAQAQVDAIPDIPAATPVLPIARVAVVGAGTMGGGIAMNFANIGLPVTLLEQSAQALERGLATIRGNYERSLRRGRLDAAQLEQRMALITGTLEIADLGDADLLIEAVFEEMAVKRDLFQRLDRIAKPAAILASNTSFLNIDELAAATSRPRQVLGMHFFSPANVMALLEIVRGARTDRTVVATAQAVARRIGKIGVVVRVCDGFAGNRIIVQRRSQGQALLLEGALPWQVDGALEAFGFPMGPFAMSDLAGLDIGWSAENSRGETIRDVLCEMGRRGQKSGAGYYDYDDRTRRPSPLVAETVGKFLAQRGVAPRSIDDEEILQRCLYPMINEGAKLLEEKIVVRASDIDVVMVNGYGWPKERGGLMYYADSIGLDRVVAVLRALERQLGPAMKPAPLLERLAEERGVLHRVVTHASEDVRSAVP